MHLNFNAYIIRIQYEPVSIYHSRNHIVEQIANRNHLRKSAEHKRQGEDGGPFIDQEHDLVGQMLEVPHCVGQVTICLLPFKHCYL